MVFFTGLMTGQKDSFEVQRSEVVNIGRRRRWRLKEKLRIVEESFQDHRQAFLISNQSIWDFVTQFGPAFGGEHVSSMFRGQLLDVEYRS